MTRELTGEASLGEDSIAILDEHINVEKIKKCFQNRPALGAPDTDGGAH